MMLSDLGAGVATIAVLILYSSGNLQIWHLYIAGAVSGIFATFQWPAYSAAITTMLPKDQYARASGLLGLADSISNVFAPVFATALLILRRRRSRRIAVGMRNAVDGSGTIPTKLPSGL